MKKGILLLLLSMALSSVASCHAAETEADGGKITFPESNETDSPEISDEIDSPVTGGFARVPPLEQPEFLEEDIDSIWLEETEEEYYQQSDLIAKGTASGLTEYHVFGEHYDYYITAFDFELSEVFFGENKSVGDTVSVGVFNSTYEYDESLPTILEDRPYILFLHSASQNEQIGDIVDYNTPSPLFNCIPVVGDYCETKEIFSDYGESERKINIIKGKSLAYEALQNGEKAELKEDFADENYLALANEEAKYIFNKNSFENKLATTFVVRLAEFEETLRDRVKEFKTVPHADASRVYSYDYALSDEELAEGYADLSAKLYPYGKENAEQTISAEGLAHMNEARAEMDRHFAENGSEEDRKYAEENGMYDFMLEDRQFFPAADGGLFAVYGYRMLGELCASYYDVFFLSASEETLLYTGQHSQLSTDFLGNGEKLMMISENGQYGLICVLDRNGERIWLDPQECGIAVPAGAE